jgi:hypothetical protein
MRKISGFIAAILCGVTMSQGCNEAPPAATSRVLESAAKPSGSADPVEALRKLVRSDKLGNHVRAADVDNKYIVEAWIEPKSVKIDVRKTDSLVSPLVGVVALDVLHFGEYDTASGGKKVGPTSGSRLEFLYNYVDGQWVPQEKFRMMENLALIGPQDDFHSKTDWLIKQRPYLLKVLGESLEKW